MTPRSSTSVVRLSAASSFGGSGASRSMASAPASATPHADDPPRPAPAGKSAVTRATAPRMPARRKAAVVRGSSDGAAPSTRCTVWTSSAAVAVAYLAIARLQTTPPSRSQYGGTSVQPPPKSSREGARATMARVTPVPLRGVVVNDAPSALAATHQQGGGTARGDGVASTETTRQRVLADEIHHVGRHRIDIEDHERQRVAHGAGREHGRVPGPDRRRATHDPAASDERRRVARQVVVDERVEVTAIPVDRRARQHGLELGADRGPFGRRSVICTHRARAPGG